MVHINNNIIMLVVLARRLVTSVMVVMLKIAMTYLVTCQFTGTWRMHLQELPWTPFVLLLLRISGFTTSICVFNFFIFLSYIFWIHGHPPHIKKCAIMWVFYWVPDNSISWNCVKISIVSLRYSRKIFFPGMTDLQRNLAKFWVHIGLERASKLKKCHGWSLLIWLDDNV